ncbi:hypothetical protein F4861DRAFT_541228 [Xylaria intraflava]|nr:hypothetical protein F4861DRAFT_541228 [Xylaria intraflava]
MTGTPQINRPSSNGPFPSQTALPSPAPSTASSRVAALLPHPRSKPLAPGSRKEDYARDYVARKLLHISRRYVKKFGIPDPADEVTGYESMDEVCRDLEEVVDVLWFSGTPSLQIPYLLNVALAFNTYLPSFPPSPRSTFAFLRKLDHCFASLLVGYDVKTKDPLPGFSSTVDNSTKLRFSRTDMVRCKSLADETRMLVAMVVSGEVDVDDADEESAAERPTQRGSGARSKSVDAADSTSNSPHEVGMVKTEEIETDDDELDLRLTDESPTPPTKRKADEMADDIVMTDQISEPKRIKAEDEEDSIVGLNNIESADTSGDPPKDSDKGQFHWALEDDDSDDEDRPSGAMPINKGAPPSPPQPPDLDVVRDDDHGMKGNDANEEDELGEYEDEDEDEDEELQMNVGKVYQKTLVQLGQSLGQSILDD